jgi:methylmalonyl-CoA mutase C-terminal domain/subunit
MERPGKVLIAEIATDEHDRGAQSLAARLRDGGLEVVYTGAAGDAALLARCALDEDVDVIALWGPATAQAPVDALDAALRACRMSHVGIVLAGGLGGVDEREALGAVQDLVARARQDKSGKGPGGAP